MNGEDFRGILGCLDPLHVDTYQEKYMPPAWIGYWGVRNYVWTGLGMVRGDGGR